MKHTPQTGRRAPAQGIVEYSLIIALMGVVLIGGALIVGPAIPYILNALSALL